MTATTFIGHFLGPDTHANRPAASGLPNGTLYVCTTHSKIERVVSGAWADYATLGGSASSDSIYTTKGDIAVATGAATAVRHGVGADGTILTADSAQTDGVRWATPAAGGIGAILYDSTLSSAAASFDVSSISGAYSTLVCLLYARTDEAITISSVNGRFNNDSGSNYYWADQNFDTTNGVGTAGSGSADARFLLAAPGANAPANSFGMCKVEAFAYANTSYLKEALTEYGLRLDTTRVKTARGTAQWASTSAINRVTFLPATAGKNFVAGSRLVIQGF